MGQAINRAISRILVRLFGPNVGAWVDENGVPFVGIILLLVFVGFAWVVSHDSRQEVEGQTPEERRRNRRFGRWAAAVLSATGIALLGRSLTFGTFEAQKVQEVVWSLVAGALGTTAWVLLMAWWWPTLTRGGRWKMRAGLVVPVALGTLLAVVGATRSPPPPTAQEVAAARVVVRKLGGEMTGTEPKTDSPTGVSFHKGKDYTRMERVDDEIGHRFVTIALRDDDLPPLLDAMRKLTALKTVDLSDTELTPAGVERVRAAVPNATVTGPTK